jgi:predicted SAM-dependent methyltransferase
MTSFSLLRRALRPAKAALRRVIKRRRLRKQIAASQPLRVVLGAGGVYEPGWIATDVDLLDIAKQKDWHRVFTPSTIDTLLAEHVWEHLEPEAGRCAARNCFTFLKAGGHLRAAVPDGLHPNPQYRESVRPGGSGPGADDHRLLYDYHTFSAIFATCGFRVELLEYFDETGVFIYRPWDASDGMIHRSSRHDERNADGTLCYTSIVLDALKEAP